MRLHRIRSDTCGCSDNSTVLLTREVMAHMTHGEQAPAGSSTPLLPAVLTTSHMAATHMSSEQVSFFIKITLIFICGTHVCPHGKYACVL